MYFNENKKAHKTYMHTTFPNKFNNPLHPYTISERVGQVHRNSIQKTESALVLATAYNL